MAMPRLEQDGLSISLSVTWADGGGTGGAEDTAPLVDIWYTARQPDPVNWVQMPVFEVRGGGGNGGAYREVGARLTAARERTAGNNFVVSRKCFLLFVLRWAATPCANVLFLFYLGVSAKKSVRAELNSGKTD